MCIIKLYYFRGPIRGRDPYGVPRWLEVGPDAEDNSSPSFQPGKLAHPRKGVGGLRRALAKSQ